MAKEELLEFECIVNELLPNASFRVELENGHEGDRSYRWPHAQEQNSGARRR